MDEGEMVELMAAAVAEEQTPLQSELGGHTEEMEERLGKLAPDLISRSPCMNCPF